MKAAGGYVERTARRAKETETDERGTDGWLRPRCPGGASSLLGLWTAKLAARVFVDLSFDAWVRDVGTLAPAECWLLFSCVGVAWLVCVACTHHPSQESADGQYTHDSVPRKYNKEDVRREDA